MLTSDICIHTLNAFTLRRASEHRKTQRPFAHSRSIRNNIFILFSNLQFKLIQYRFSWQLLASIIWIIEEKTNIKTKIRRTFATNKCNKYEKKIETNSDALLCFKLLKYTVSFFIKSKRETIHFIGKHKITNILFN